MFTLQKCNALRKYVIKRKTFKLRHYWKCFYDKYISVVMWRRSERDRRFLSILEFRRGVNYRALCRLWCDIALKGAILENLNKPKSFTGRCDHELEKKVLLDGVITVKRHCRLVGLGRVYFSRFYLLECRREFIHWKRINTYLWQ